MKNKKANIYVRILAIVLCALMVASMAFYTIYMIVDNVKNSKKEELVNQGGYDHVTLPVEYTFTI